MKKSLYLHIGTEKTGTTTIQDTLFQSYDYLKSKGILYPKTFKIPNHIAFCVAFQDIKSASNLNIAVGAGLEESEIKKFKENILANLKDEITKSRCHTVIISNEHLSSRIKSYSEIENIRNWLKTIFDEIYIVCYLRRQLDFAISAYSTSIKSGNNPPYLLPKFDILPHYYNYKKILDMWSVYFPNIICREFSKSTLKDSDVVMDFFNILSLDISIDKIKLVKNRNKTLDEKALKFLMQVNKYVPEIINGKMNRDRKYLIKFLEDIPVGNLILPNKEEAIKFQSYFDEDNQYISNKYFDGKLLFQGKLKFKNLEDNLEDVDIYMEVFKSFLKSTSDYIYMLESTNLSNKEKNI